MSGIASLAQDWWYNVEVVLGFLDGRLLGEVALSWPVAVAVMIFPATMFFSNSDHPERWVPVIGGMQVFAFLSVASFPAIYAGPAAGYYRLMLREHLSLIAVAVLLALGAYYVMWKFRRDMPGERVLAGVCMVILLGKIFLYRS